jgi:hypothetical protein
MMNSSQSSDELQWPSSASRITSLRSKKYAQSDPPSSRKPRTRVKKETVKSSVKRSRGPHRNRRQELLERLGMTSEQIDQSPQIAPLLRQCGILPQRVIEVLRSDLVVDSVKVVQLWDQLTPANRSLLGMEGLALGCGITPRRLWEVYCGASLMQSRESVGAMIADALPAIMRVTIKDAKRVKGFASRETIYKAVRVLPTPKGTVINLPGSKPIGELESPSEGDGDDDGMLEPADDFLMRTARAMGTKALPAPVPTIQAEVEDDGDEEE